MAPRAADSDTQLYDYESAAALRKRGWIVIDPYTMDWIGRHRCAHPACISMIPKEWQLCHFHRGRP